MKWPQTLTVIRHGESAYNAFRNSKAHNLVYVEFREAYAQRHQDPERAARLARQLMQSGTFALGFGDHNTAMTERGQNQARITGRRLRASIEKPDVILVSPYERTVHTLGSMAIGWPELKDVKMVEDDRLREQEHGLALLYSDWRIFHTLHPDQGALHEAQGSYWYRYPQGENVPDVRERARSMMNTVVREYREQNVMVVTHHLWILALRANLERLGEPGYADLDENHKPINCGVTIYRGDPAQGQDGRLNLDIYNKQPY